MTHLSQATVFTWFVSHLLKTPAPFQTSRCGFILHLRSNSHQHSFGNRHDVDPKGHKSHLHFKEEVSGSSGWTCPRALSVRYACLNYSQSELMAVTGKKEGFLGEIACLKCVSGCIRIWAFWMPLKSVWCGNAVLCRVKRCGHIYHCLVNLSRAIGNVAWNISSHRFSIMFKLVRKSMH